MSDIVLEARPPQLAAAMARVQTKLPEIRKGEKALVKSDKGNYSYTYANLAQVSAQILPLLGENGLCFITKPTLVDGKFMLAYSLMHESGEREDGLFPLASGGTPQAVGSAITYARRYTLCAVTGVSPEDDDDDAVAAQAEHASRPTAPRATGQRAQSGRPRPAEQPSASPARPATDGQPAGNGITPAQMKLMQTLFGQRGIKVREDRLVKVALIIGRDVESSSDLTKSEAAAVIDTLDSEVKRPQPAAGDAE